MTSRDERQDRSSRRFWAWWRLVWPIRMYLRYSRVRKGKGLLIKLFIRPMLPAPPRSFLATLPLGGAIELQYRETIGETILSLGAFERAETAWLCAHALPDSTAIDVGANVGVVTVQLARRMSSRGRVLACEPMPANVARLEHNIQMNSLENVETLPLALGSDEGTVQLYLGTDSASHSTTEVLEFWRADESVRVQQTTLDSVWHDRGSPRVSVIKIDVEGGEIGVLQGGRELIAACAPFLLIETRVPHAGAVTRWLTARAYRRLQPGGFEPWNFAFIPHNEHGSRS